MRERPSLGLDDMQPAKISRRYFSEATRAAAVEGRRRKREAAPSMDTPDVFVVRLSGAVLQFGWEIRRFGAVVLDKSCANYSTTGDAYEAGREALSARSAEA